MVEKFILQTIIYADIFNFPLKGWEIHKWLIGTKCDLVQIHMAIEKLIKQGKLQESRGYVFLPGKLKLVVLRIKNRKQSAFLLRRAKIVATVLRIVPWIKLVGISGALAMENAGKSDDIDLFLITQSGRMWTCRLLALGIISLLGLRRTAHDTKFTSEGKICLNLILEENALEQKGKNLYTAHEVLQMRLLWQRDDMYVRFLEANTWAFEFLPNWKGVGTSLRVPPLAGRGNLYSNQDSYALTGLGMTIENLAKRFQLKIMKTPEGDERIEDHALYFHPKDYSKHVLPLDKREAV